MNDDVARGEMFRPPAEELDQMHADSCRELEERAEALRTTILQCQPKALLGYLWAQLLTGRLKDSVNEGEESAGDSTNDVVFALEYVHAVLSSHRVHEHGTSSREAEAVAVLNQATELRARSMMHCFVAASRVPDGLLGKDSGDTAFHALTTWVTLRGHRYQALEAEFFGFVLSPHEEALQRAYGVGAKAIARGIQAAVDATRFGHIRAAEEIEAAMAATAELAKKEGISFEDATRKVAESGSHVSRAASAALENLFFGGICDFSRSSGLPAELLGDLAYNPGDESDFFAAGPLRGTPMRRMPGRVKPLVQVEGQYLACDPNFLRDSSYRALQWGLLARLPDYKEEWGRRQAAMAEDAFLKIFGRQLRGSEAWTSFYYRDSKTGR